MLPARVNPITGRIHTTFSRPAPRPADSRRPTRTCRTSRCAPRAARPSAGASCPRTGWRFIAADYSQIELRLLAHFSGDPAFVAAFRQGDDIHRQTAAIIFGVPVAQVTSDMRARAKTINFATIYGQGPFALSRQLGITQDEARAFIAHYFERFAGVRAWLDRQVALGQRTGLGGNAVPPPPLRPRDQGQELQHPRLRRAAGAELTAAGLGRRPDQDRDDPAARRAPAERLSGRLLLQVHDELVLEAPPEEVGRVIELVRTHMEGAAQLSVPLVVDVGEGANWVEAKA